MNAETFSELVARVLSDVRKISEAVEADYDLLGSLTLEDYQVITGMVKELVWVKG